MPERFAAEVTYADRPIRVRIEATFDGTDAWGKPRQAIMSAFELPRSTANHWIRKAREKYGLPGAHAESEV